MLNRRWARAMPSRPRFCPRLRVFTRSRGPWPTAKSRKRDGVGDAPDRSHVDGHPEMVPIECLCAWNGQRTQANTGCWIYPLDEARCFAVTECGERVRCTGTEGSDSQLLSRWRLSCAKMRKCPVCFVSSARWRVFGKIRRRFCRGGGGNELCWQYSHSREADQCRAPC